MLPLLLSAVLTLGPVDIEYSPLEGEPVPAQLLELDSSHAEILIDGEPQSIPRALLSVIAIAPSELHSEQAAPYHIALVDGSQIRANAYSVERGQATVELLNGQSLEISTRLILSVRMKPPAPLLDARWNEIVAREIAEDQLVVRRSEEVLDYLEGVIQEVSPERITFLLNGTAREVSLDRIEGLVYYHRRAEALPAAVCLARDGNGNQWNLQNVALIESGISATTLCGIEYLFPLTDPLELDYSSGNRMFLSQLTPESSSWTPFVGGPVAAEELQQYFRVRINRTMEGPLQLYSGEPNNSIKEYANGLHIRSRTELVYRLPQGFSRLRGLAGIDARVRPNGSVRLIIRGDGTVLFDELITGELSSLAAENAPRDLDLDITGVSRLEFLIDYADDFSWSDHLNLCNLRITK